MNDSPGPEFEEEPTEMTPEEEQELLRGAMPPSHLFPQCEVCGKQHARLSAGGTWHPTCTAHKPQRNELGEPDWTKPTLPCMKFRNVGLVVCETHGGGNRQARGVSALAKAERLEEKKRERARAKFRIQAIEDEFRRQHPIEGLLDEVARSAQIVAFLAAEVETLWVTDFEDFTEFSDLAGFDEDGHPVRVPNRSKLIGLDHNNDLSKHPLWIALNEERMRHAKLCEMALKAGVAEKMVNLAQQQAALVAHTLVEVLSQLGLDAQTQANAKMLLANILRAGGPQAYLARRKELPT